MNATLERPSGPLIIRADASTQIGIGHVMRCLALAQAWQDAGGQVAFMRAMEVPAMEARLQSEGMEVVHLSAGPGGADDATQTAHLARQMEAAWVVLDGYHFGSDYQRIIKESGSQLLAVDDHGHADHYYADIVLNQNLHAHEDLYEQRESYTRLLLGTRYVLLRREFLKWRLWKREIPAVARKVLVTLGGGDPNNVTLRVIQALQQVEVKGLEAVAVAGGSNPHYQKLQSAVRDSRVPIRLERTVTNMADLMAWADAAVSAAGSTSWERVFMGLPGLVLILTDNQRAVARQLGMIGLAVDLGWHENLRSPEIAQAATQLLVAAEVRTQMAQCSQELVDGEGVARVLMLLSGEMLELREVREEDCRLLWEWANDPEVRAVSFSSEPVPWEEHVRWFKSKVNDTTCILHIAMDAEGTPIGQIRYDINGNEAVISTSIDRRLRRKGYGTRLISLACRKVFEVSDVDMLHAYIKQGNEPSVRAFVKAGFRETGTTVIRGCQAIHLVLRRGGLT